MKYQFISKYGGVKDIVLGIGRNINGHPERLVKCVFNNAIFETDDDEIARALQGNQYFGTDFWLNEAKKEVVDKYGDNRELANKLKKKKFQELRSIAMKGKGRLGNPKELFKLKKDELILYLLKNPERTEALM